MRVPGLKLMVMAFALSGALFFVACGGGDDDGDSTAEPTDTMEPTATATEVDGDGGDGGDPSLFDGATVAEFFSQNCASCHGENREGIDGLGLPLLPDRLTEDDEFYADTIKNGREGTVMPAWGDLGVDDAEIDALIAFIRTEP